MQHTVVDNRYTLVEPLGSGGMAEVYLARDKILERDVALKVLDTRYAEDQEFVERFRREARSAASLSHPNIVYIYDQGRSKDGAYYIAMEYVSQGTLKDRIRRDGALKPAAVVGVTLQIADALQAAHEKGVIHRDIKPQNVLVTEKGDIKVTDFGIARATSTSTLTSTDHVLGTADYMSPEQARGEPAGPESDLYSLGVVLYEMLTGNLPYDTGSALAQAIKHVNELPPSPKEVNPEAPEALDALTMKLLAKNPEDRYPSAAALANDLERIRSGLLSDVEQEKTEVVTAPLSSYSQARTQRTAVRPPVAVPLGAPRPDGRRWGRLLYVVAALLFVLAVLGGLAFSKGFFEGFDPAGPDVSSSRSDAENVGADKAKVATPADDSGAADISAGELRNGNWSGVPVDEAPTNEGSDQGPAVGNVVEPDTVVGTGFVQTSDQSPDSAPDSASNQLPNDTDSTPSPPQASPPQASLPQASPRASAP
ncbi:MAG TPA: protein kinase, partial [Rubrobacteraceae bacterium]|nr:protein kinase [Rubrobacteraceae bacterium]